MANTITHPEINATLLESLRSAGLRQQGNGPKLGSGISSLLDTSSLVEVRNFEIEDPRLKALIERIKNAALPYEKKERLIKLLLTILKSAQGKGGKSQDDFIKEFYSLIEMLELTERYKLSPEELNEHKKKLDNLVFDFLAEEERSRQLGQMSQQAADYKVQAYKVMMSGPPANPQEEIL